MNNHTFVYILDYLAGDRGSRETAKIVMTRATTLSFTKVRHKPVGDIMEIRPMFRAVCALTAPSDICVFRDDGWCVKPVAALWG